MCGKIQVELAQLRISPTSICLWVRVGAHPRVCMQGSNNRAVPLFACKKRVLADYWDPILLIIGIIIDMMVMMHELANAISSSISIIFWLWATSGCYITSSWGLGACTWPSDAGDMVSTIIDVTIDTGSPTWYWCCVSNIDIMCWWLYINSNINMGVPSLSTDRWMWSSKGACSRMRSPWAWRWSCFKNPDPHIPSQIPTCWEMDDGICGDGLGLGLF